MEYDEKFIKTVVNLGGLGYDIEKSVNVLDIEKEADIAQFRKDFLDKNSPIFKAYKRGQDKAEFAIDIKLFQKATEGDMKALQKYEERQAYKGRG